MIDNDGNGLVDDWLEGISGDNAAQIICQPSGSQAQHGAGRDALRHPGRGGGAAGLGVQPRRLHRQGGRDTDGDGLPEFVDAWGQPLQFFRWPLLYHSDIQRGQAFVSTAPQTWSLIPPYAGAAGRSASRTRWIPTSSSWRPRGGRRRATGDSRLTGLSVHGPPGARSSPGANVSPAAQFFGTFFHTASRTAAAFRRWRGLGPVGTSYRRAFFTKFLVLSGGQDQVPGVFLYTDDYLYPKLRYPSPPTSSRRISSPTRIMRCHSAGTLQALTHTSRTWTS